MCTSFWSRGVSIVLIVMLGLVGIGLGERLYAQEPSSGNAGEAPLFSPVTWERLVNAADEPHNWLMYNGTLDSKRYSRLALIDNQNAAEIGRASVDRRDELFFLRDQEYVEGESFTGGGTQTPLPIDHYTSAIRALDPTTGDLRWEFPITPRSRAERAGEGTTRCGEGAIPLRLQLGVTFAVTDSNISTGT